jgi:hypothetical protein
MPSHSSFGFAEIQKDCTVEVIDGDISVKRKDGGKLEPLKSGMRVYAGDELYWVAACKYKLVNSEERQ